MRVRFEDWAPRPDAQERVAQCQDIVEEYRVQGLRLTLRQLYYQFVARNLIPNTEKSYRNLGSIVGKARMAGLLDWEAIEDRGRTPSIPSEFSSLSDLIEVALRSYRLDRWQGQASYVELWVEKAALAGVLAPIANRFHVPLMVNKGYSSLSAMYESAGRFVANGRYCDCSVLYLGDHDPSGQDMVRDIEHRLNTFTGLSPQIQVESIALTTEQVEQYDPPPNPTKLKDSRAAGYIERHGYECWEVDALDPGTLRELIESRFDALIDRALMDDVIRQETSDRRKLREAVADL